jgi:hypothetical protein
VAPDDPASLPAAGALVDEPEPAEPVPEAVAPEALEPEPLPALEPVAEFPDVALDPDPDPELPRPPSPKKFVLASDVPHPDANKQSAIGTDAASNKHRMTRMGLHSLVKQSVYPRAIPAGGRDERRVPSPKRDGRYRKGE